MSKFNLCTTKQKFKSLTLQYDNKQYNSTDSDLSKFSKSLNARSSVIRCAFFRFIHITIVNADSSELLDVTNFKKHGHIGWAPPLKELLD